MVTKISTIQMCLELHKLSPTSKSKGFVRAYPEHASKRRACGAHLSAKENSTPRLWLVQVQAAEREESKKRENGGGGGDV